MVQNNKEHLNPGADQPEKKNPETQKYREERNQAINEAKKLEHELAHKLEAHEHHREKEETLAAMRQSDAPQISPENNSREKNQLDEMFREIRTDDALYDYSRTLFPKFTETCEQSALGKSFSRDILWLALGVGDSLLSTLRLGKDVVIDFAKLVYQPRKEIQNTKQILEDTRA